MSCEAETGNLSLPVALSFTAFVLTTPRLWLGEGLMTHSLHFCHNLLKEMERSGLVQSTHSAQEEEWGVC